MEVRRLLQWRNRPRFQRGSRNFDRDDLLTVRQTNRMSTEEFKERPTELVEQSEKAKGKF